MHNSLILESVCAEADSAFLEPFLTAGDVAQNLHVTERTVLRWARENKLRAYKFGKFWRFRASDVNQTLLDTVDSFASQSTRVN